MPEVSDRYLRLAQVMPVDNVVDSYGDLVEQVYRHGLMIAPREKVTFEVMGLMVVSDDPTVNMIPSGDQRDFLESEIETIKAGQPPKRAATPELIERLDLEEDGTFFEEGVRTAISSNWDHWVELLRKEDASSRKIATVFTTPDDKNPPCTMFLQFLVRNGRLHMFTVNRSQDLYFAYPMDMGLFETLQCEMAEELSAVNNVDVGLHKHLMISAHLYEEQYDEWSDVF